MSTRPSPLRVASVLGLVAALTGCTTTTSPLREPPNQPEPEIGEEQPDEQALAEFAEAVASYAAAKQDGELSQAECEAVAARFDQAYVGNESSLPIARFNVGAVWEECGDIAKASEIYEELAAKRYHLALNQLGVLAWNRGDDKQALELFTRSVAADKKQAFAARNNLAAAHRERYAEKLDQTDFEIAEDQLQNVLAVDTSNKAAYENLARLYYDRGRLEDPSYLVLANLVVTQALRVLDKQGQRSADLWNLEGLLLMQDDNQVDALKAFKKAVEIEPNHPDANRNIGFIAIRFRDYATAEGSFAVALESAAVERDVEVYIAMGVAKRGLSKFAEAEDWYRKAAKIDGDDPRPWYNLAVLNQDHLPGRPDIDQPQIVAYYETAKQHCNTFNAMAEPNKAYAEAVADCRDRIAIIDDTFRVFADMAAAEARLIELQKKAEEQELERRAKLIELEQQAMAAGQPSPSELAEAEAEAEYERERLAEQAQASEAQE